jgi:hypothetical protein
MDIKDLVIPDSEENDIEKWVNRMKQICFETEPTSDQIIPTFDVIFQRMQNETLVNMAEFKQSLLQRYLEFVQSEEFNKFTQKRFFEKVRNEKTLIV